VVGGEEMEPNKGVVKIATGDSVEFSVNVGLHNITINKETRVDPFQAGDTETIAFDTDGEYDITCTYHPAMFAKLFVRDQ
jgi:plastocyanin